MCLWMQGQSVPFAPQSGRNLVLEHFKIEASSIPAEVRAMQTSTNSNIQFTIPEMFFRTKMAEFLLSEVCVHACEEETGSQTQLLTHRRTATPPPLHRPTTQDRELVILSDIDDTLYQVSTHDRRCHVTSHPRPTPFVSDEYYDHDYDYEPFSP